MRARNTRKMTSEIKGMTVLVPFTGERLGRVLDAIVHPTKGRILALVFRTQAGEEALLTGDELLIGVDTVE